MVKAKPRKVISKAKVTSKSKVKKAKGTKGMDSECCSSMNGSGKNYGGCRMGLYCWGFLGSAIYFVSTATGFWNGVWGVVKSLVWPAILVFESMKFMGL
ncbi:MAG: hypothetical protein ACI83O_000736 [Patescibacteria group bacterium]|jgi:hypothetical protein